MGSNPAGLTQSVRLYGTARHATEKALGGPTRENETNPTIQTTATMLVAANPDRVGLVIINLGTNDVYMALNNGVSTSNGVKLSAGGGNVSLNVNDDFTLVAREWDAIANGGTSAVYVLEILSDIYTPAGE
jgi:hypothetical protein